MGGIAGSVMTARKMMLLTLAFLLPCGFVILLTRSVLRSSFGERFLKGTAAMTKLAFLATAVVSVAGMTAGCGQHTQAQGRGATASGSQPSRAVSTSKDGNSKAGVKSPGELLAQDKKLSDKLSALLSQQNPPATDLQPASQGFKVLAQFVLVVHISHNLGIPFDQLKTHAQTSGSYIKAIHVLRPDVDPKAEVMKAARQALDDMQESASAS
jgi:hypothetical protein